MNIPFMKRNVPRLAGPEENYDEPTQRVTEQFRVDLVEHLRSNPVVRSRPSEYAPRPDYSIEQTESFIAQHLEECAMARATLAVEISAAEEHLADLKRRQNDTTIVHDALAETLTKLTGRVAVPDAPKDEQTGEQQS